MKKNIKLIALIFIFCNSCILIPTVTITTPDNISSTGVLDSTFGTNGVVTIGINYDDTYACDALIQSDGKIVVAGYSIKRNFLDGYISGGGFALVRLNQDGNLDTSFGDGGVVTMQIGESMNYSPAIAIQADGKIVMITDYYKEPYYVFAIVRINSDGSFDTDFGTDGIITTNINNTNAYAHAIVIKPDGKIIVAGNSGVISGFNGEYSYSSGVSVFTLVQYNNDGSLDTSFGTNGITTTNIGTTDSGTELSGHVNTMALQPDGKIIVVGYDSNSNFITVRYNSNGTLDDSFGSYGIVSEKIGTGNSILSSYSNGIAISNNNNLVIAGNSVNANFSNFILVQYNYGGEPDINFGTNGVVITDMGDSGTINDIVITSDDKIIVAGSSNYNSFILARYTSEGIIDTTFGLNGIIQTTGGGSANKVAIQSDGKIVVVGTAYNRTPDFAITRYIP